MRKGWVVFFGTVITVGLGVAPLLAAGDGATVLFSPSRPNFQHSQFTDVSSDFGQTSSHFQDHSAAFQAADLDFSRNSTSASDERSRVQSDMGASTFENGVDGADMTNDAERASSFSSDRQSRFANMRMQFASPDFQFLNFNP